MISPTINKINMKTFYRHIHEVLDKPIENSEEPTIIRAHKSYNEMITYKYHTPIGKKDSVRTEIEHFPNQGEKGKGESNIYFSVNDNTITPTERSRKKNPKTKLLKKGALNKGESRAERGVARSPESIKRMYRRGSSVLKAVMGHIQHHMSLHPNTVLSFSAPLVARQERNKETGKTYRNYVSDPAREAIYNRLMKRANIKRAEHDMEEQHMKSFEEYITEVKFKKAKRAQRKAIELGGEEYLRLKGMNYAQMDAMQKRRERGVRPPSDYPLDASHSGLLRQVWKASQKPENKNSSHINNVLKLIHTDAWPVHNSFRNKEVEEIQKSIQKIKAGKRGTDIDSLHPNI